MRPEGPKIEAAGRNRGRRPSWCPKGGNGGLIDTMANATCPLVNNNTESQEVSNML